jgi:hypothetical protein
MFAGMWAAGVDVPQGARRAYARSVEVDAAEMVRLPANASTMNLSAVSA